MFNSACLSLAGRRRAAAVLFASGVIVLYSILSAAALVAGRAGDDVVSTSPEQTTESLLANRQLLLHEDVTSPHVRKSFLFKFSKAKAHHASRVSLLDSLAGITSLGAKGQTKKMSTAAKAAIAAKMKALRQKILGDFSSNTRFGKRADCSYPYPAASCKDNAISPPHRGASAGAMPMAFGSSR